MSLKYALRNIDTGEVLEDKDFTLGLTDGKFFSSLDELDEMHSRLIRDTGRWPYAVLDSHGAELPHFFSDTPMFTMRHRTGFLFGKWYDTPGKAKARFICRPDRYDEGNEEMLRPECWEVVDHRRRVVRSGMVYDPYVPEEAGLFAVGRKIGAAEYVYEKSSGPKRMRPWFKRLRDLKAWVASSGQCMFVEKYRNQTKLKPAKGLYLVRTLGNGQYEKVMDFDLFC